MDHVSPGHTGRANNAPFKCMTEGARSAARGGDPVLSKAHQANIPPKKQHGKKVKGGKRAMIATMEEVTQRPSHPKTTAPIHHKPAPHEACRLAQGPHLSNGKLVHSCGKTTRQCRFRKRKGGIPCSMGQGCPDEQS